jgi:hypothetical protein
MHHVHPSLFVALIGPYNRVVRLGSVPNFDATVYPAVPCESLYWPSGNTWGLQVRDGVQG